MKRKNFIYTALSALCLCAMVGAAKVPVVNVDAANAENGHFIATGGSYDLGKKENAAEDGIPMTITPSEAGNDVNLVFNGAYKRMPVAYGGQSGRNAHSNKVLLCWDGTLDATAVVYTFHSTLDETAELTFIASSNGSVYFSLTDDVSFDETAAPYVTGTEQYLVPWTDSASAENFDGSVQMTFTDDGWVYLNDSTCKHNVFEKNWISNSSEKLSGDLKARYDEDRLKDVLYHKMDVCSFEMTVVGMQKASSVRIRAFNGATHYSSQSTLELRNDLPLVMPKYERLICGYDYSLEDVFAFYAPASTLSGEEITAYVSNEPITAWEEGTYLNSKTATFTDDGADYVYFACKGKTSASGKESPVTIGKFSFVSDVSEIIEQTGNEITWGEKVNASEIFADKTRGALGNLKIVGTAFASATDSVAVDLGTTDGVGGWVVNKVNTESTVVLKLKVGMDGLDCYTAEKEFVFNVDLNKPVVVFNARTLLDGHTFDLGKFIEYHAVGEYTTTFYVDDVALQGTQFDATEGTYEIKCVITDDRGYEGVAVKTFAVETLGLQEKVSGIFERNVTTYFPYIEIDDPVLSYTVCVYDAEGTLLTNKPYYTFENSGEYKIVYTVTLGEVGPFTHETVYEVVVEPKRPTIALDGEYLGTYYEGLELPIIGARATDGSSYFLVGVSVKRDGEGVACNGLSLKLEPGVYELSYTVDYAWEKQVTKIVSFQVLKDEETPSLTLNGSYEKSYEGGMTIGVLKAYAMDNSKAQIVPTVEVYKGKTAIKNVGETLTLDGGAKYKIVYTAVDGAGNRAQIVYEFNTMKDSKKKGGCNGCGSVVSGTVLGAVTLLAAGVVMLRKGGKKDD